MGNIFTNAYAPSTLSSFLRSFTFGHGRQLDGVAARFLTGLATATPLAAGVDDYPNGPPSPPRRKRALLREATIPATRASLVSQLGSLTRRASASRFSPVSAMAGIKGQGSGRNFGETNALPQ